MPTAVTQRLRERKEISQVSIGKTLLAKRLGSKQALIILDDLNNEDQVKALAGHPSWFGRGSRIIITTANAEVAKYLERSPQPRARNWRPRVYEVKELCEKHSLELLRYHAFEENRSEPGYEDLLKGVVRYACNIPLALEVLGRLLRQRDQSEWKESINGWNMQIPGDM